MTLVAIGIHKHQAFTVVDSRLSDGIGRSVEEDSLKSFFLEASDGKALIAFTGGITDVEGVPLTEWLIRELADLCAARGSLTEALALIRSLLDEHIQQHHTTPPPLVVSVAGWRNLDTRKPFVSVVSNVHSADRSTHPSSFYFEIVDFEIPNHGASLIVLGDMKATRSLAYRTRARRIEKLLRQHSNKLDEKTLDEMIILVRIAAEDQSTTTINDRVKASRMHRKSTGVTYKSFPEERDYALPGFVSPNMSVFGSFVKNDFVEGGITKIGGN